MNVTVIGLGKLGSPMAACYAAKGHNVIGVDVSTAFVDKINQLEPPVFEPGLADMLRKTDGRLRATTDLEDAVAKTDITFVIVPTPSDSTGGFSLKFALAACRSIGKALKNKPGYHLVVMTSTVMPGATGGELKRCLESASGKTCGQDFGLCYSPEFISLGSVIRDLLNPDFLLIGESDPRAGDLLVAFYQGVYENCPKIARMGMANAEVTKLAVNTFVTTKISYANMLAEICERLDGGNVDEVTTALGMDTRIGPKYLKGSLGYGGPCFPRDNVALTTLCQQLGVTAPLPRATDRINQHQVPRLCQMIKAALPADGRVGIVGLSYKPATNVIERAQGVEIAQALLEENIAVTVHDPHALDSARPVLHGPVCFAESLTDCTRQADVLLIVNPDKDCQALTPNQIKPGCTIIDCWRQLDRNRFPQCTYIGLGTCDVRDKLSTEAAVKDVLPFAA